MGAFLLTVPVGKKTKQNKTKQTNKQTKPKVFWPLIAAYVSVKYIWTSWFCRVYHIFKSAIITKTTSRERLFEGPKNAKIKELSLSGENASLTRPTLATLRCRYMQKNSQNKNTLSDFILPLQMHVQNHERVQKFWFYPFRKKLKENPAMYKASRFKYQG